MTVTDNDRIRLLIVIREEEMDDCNIMVISKLAYIIVSACTMFCIVGTVHIPFRSIPFFALFTRILTKIYQEIPRFSPFILPFTPLIFAF